MALSIPRGNWPSPSRRDRRSRLSGTAVLLAGATSAAVLYSWAVGSFSAPMAATAAVGACLIAAISARHARPLADVLAPLPDGATGPVVIRAPRASETARHTDAA